MSGKERKQTYKELRSPRDHSLSQGCPAGVWRKGWGWPSSFSNQVRQGEPAEGGSSDSHPSQQSPQSFLTLLSPLPPTPPLLGATTRGHSCSCLPLGPPGALRAPPQRWQAAPLGPCRGRAPFLVWPLRAAGRHLVKAACSQPERRGLGTDPGRSYHLRGAAPGLVDRRDQRKAGLASRGHSRGPHLWSQRVQER